MPAEQRKHSIGCVGDGWRPELNEEDGVKVQEVVEAAYPVREGGQARQDPAALAP